MINHVKKFLSSVIISKEKRYSHFKWQRIDNRTLRKFIRHTDMYLYDVYGMFKIPNKNIVDCGGCNFSIVLILLCVIDGMARNIYPLRDDGDEGKEFKQLIREKLYWDHRNNNWLNIGDAAKILYVEFRNPLVHALAKDEATAYRKSRIELKEPTVSKWGNIEKKYQNIEYLEELEEWNNNWPIMREEIEEDGSRVVLCAAALFWAVKNMCNDLFQDEAIIEAAKRQFE